MKNINFLLILILLDIVFTQNLIKYEEIDSISIIKLTDNNKYDIEFLNEFIRILNKIILKNTNVLILTGEGDKFFSKENKSNEKNLISEYNTLMSNIFQKIENYPIPVIAVVNGMAIGESFELAVCCDFIICSENTFFGFSDKDKSIFYEFEKPQRLLNFIEKGIAKRIFLVKDNISSHEAYRIGLVNSYHPQNQILEEGIKLAKLISKNSKTAIKNSKLSINEGTKIISVIPEEKNEINFLISIYYKTQLDEYIYILGNRTDIGNWKEKKYKLHISKGFIWKNKFTMKKSDKCIQYKFVCVSKYSEIWENGPNRLLCPYNIENLPLTSLGFYELNLEWNHFHINFNLHYPIVPPNFIIKLGFKEEPKELEIFSQNNKNPIAMEFSKDKIMIKNNNKLSGIWSITIPVNTSNINKNYLDLEYKYSLYNIKNNTFIWERGPNRKLRILLSEEKVDKEKDSYANSYLLKNSKLDLIDVNFVALLDFNKIGNTNIYIGPYLETEQDFESIYKNGINAVLNVQTNKDLEYRQLDINILRKYASKYNINIERYPIEDFSQDELYQKLKVAGDLLNNLIKKGKNVYVHCTAGIGRAPSVVIIYLVLYQNYSINDAVELCKEYRPKISPNIEIITDIVKIHRQTPEL